MVGKRAISFIKSLEDCDAPIKWFRIHLREDIPSQVAHELESHRSMKSGEASEHEKKILKVLLNAPKVATHADVVILLDRTIQVRIFFVKQSAALHNNLTPQEIVLNLIKESLKGLECEIRSYLNWPELKRGERYILGDDPKQGRLPGSQHMVFHTTMRAGAKCFEIVIKYYKSSPRSQKAALMSTLHAQQKVENYKALASHIHAYDFKDINVNAVCIAKTTVDGHYLWIEKELKQFERFNHPYASKMMRVASVSSSHPRLRVLQKSIYEASGYQRTVCDLQGLYHNGKYVLGDIEFTNTIPRIGTPEELRNAFIESVRGAEDEKLPLRYSAFVLPGEDSMSYPDDAKAFFFPLPDVPDGEEEEALRDDDEERIVHHTSGYGCLSGRSGRFCRR